MKYMLLLTHDGTDVPPDPDDDDVVDDWFEMTRLLREAGVLIAGHGLHGSETATTVRREAGRRLLTDGPFAEVNEMLIGYYLIDVEDLDRAIDWAARMPNIRWGSVEIRPVLDGPASQDG